MNRAVTLTTTSLPGPRETGPSPFNSIEDALRFVADIIESAEASGRSLSYAFKMEDVITHMLTVVSYSTTSFLQDMVADGLTVQGVHIRPSVQPKLLPGT